MKIDSTHNRAFTLLEVALAMGIFFMAIFAILSLVTQNLQAVRAIQPYSVDASSLAAELMLTNKVEEGFESGDFGDLYPGYTWNREIYLVATNGLYQVDFTIFRSRGVPGEESRMSILLYRPESGTKVGSGGAAEAFRSRTRAR
jgi:Tfp pilus assembly protein PilV